MSKKKLIIEFDNQEALEHFASWLCESGEQDYWTWMESQEQEEPGPITAVTIDYHNGQNKFLPDNTIRTVCGRKTPDRAPKIILSRTEFNEKYSKVIATGDDLELPKFLDSYKEAD